MRHILYGHAPKYQILLTYLERKKYLTLRSKVEVQWRSLQYATHCLMIMHPHTKHHWPISKDKNVMVRTRKYYLKTIIWPWGQRSRSHEGHYGMWHTALWSCTQIPNIIDLSRKTKMVWPWQENTIQKTIIWPWGQRSRTHKGHNGIWHTTLWSCTHIPNIIDLSRKTKMLGLDKKILFKKQLFDLEDKDQGPTKVITVCDTPPYGHAPTYQINTI